MLKQEYDWSYLHAACEQRMKICGFLPKDFPCPRTGDEALDYAAILFEEGMLGSARDRYSKEICHQFGHHLVRADYGDGTYKLMCFFCMCSPGERGY